MSFFGFLDELPSGPLSNVVKSLPRDDVVRLRAVNRRLASEIPIPPIPALVANFNGEQGAQAMAQHVNRFYSGRVDRPVVMIVRSKINETFFYDALCDHVQRAYVVATFMHVVFEDGAEKYQGFGPDADELNKVENWRVILGPLFLTIHCDAHPDRGVMLFDGDEAQRVRARIRKVSEA